MHVRRSEIPTDLRKTLKAGFLYIVTNAAFPGFVKVGATENLDARLRAYQTSDPKRAYKMVFSIAHPDCYAGEKMVKELMKPFSKSRKNEWYEIDVHMAIPRLEEAVEEHSLK